MVPFPPHFPQSPLSHLGSKCVLGVAVLSLVFQCTRGQGRREEGEEVQLRSIPPASLLDFDIRQRHLYVLLECIQQRSSILRKLPPADPWLTISLARRPETASAFTFAYDLDMVSARLMRRAAAASASRVSFSFPLRDLSPRFASTSQSPSSALSSSTTWTSY